MIDYYSVTIESTRSKSDPIGTWSQQVKDGGHWEGATVGEVEGGGEGEAQLGGGEGEGRVGKNEDHLRAGGG